MHRMNTATPWGTDFDQRAMEYQSRVLDRSGPAVNAVGVSGH